MSTESDVIQAIRNHAGGLGQGLTDEQKMAIIAGRKNEPENTKPFDGEKYSIGLEKAMKNHPVEWLLQ